MIDPADIRFFKALQDICRQFEDVPETCRQTIDRAVETGDAQDLLNARQAVNQLEDATKSNLMRQVHLRMATDLSAIWDALPGAPGNQRPN